MIRALLIFLYPFGLVWGFFLHGLVALLLLCTVYLPERIWWQGGAFHVIPRWGLLPRKIGTGGIAAQTHWIFIFYADLKTSKNERLVTHELVHVYQCLMLGGIIHPLTYGLSYLINRIRGQNGYVAYRNIWQEKQAYRLEEEYHPTDHSCINGCCCGTE
jgi:hypothetical protein